MVLVIEMKGRWPCEQELKNFSPVESNYRIRVNMDFGSLQIGHRHVEGRSPKRVPGGIFWVGSPFSG